MKGVRDRGDRGARRERRGKDKSARTLDPLKLIGPPTWREHGHATEWLSTQTITATLKEKLC